MENKSSPCISIIVPVYNTKPYLIECMDSILIQTLSNIEVICIDDGSTDGSSDILEKYVAQDNRVHLISQPHQGAGIARNVGLEIAQGEYIIFLDSDDFFVPEMLERIYTSALENHSDIVLFNGYRYDKKQAVVHKGWFLHTEYLPDKPVFSWIDIPDNIFDTSNPAPWCKLYNHQFLLENGLHFSVQPNAEDTCFTLLSLVLAQRISVVPAELIYHRITRFNSLQYSNFEQPLCFLEEFEALYQKLTQYNLYTQLQTSFRHRVLDTILYYLRSIRTDQARIQILDALDRKPYCDLPLKEVPGIDDGNKKVHELYPRLIAAQEQYHSSLNALAAIECFNKLPQASKADPSIKVSVVIPVYNTEAYLDEALASIVEQTLKDIEIICINDGSTDGSLDILNRWAANDERFIVISQPNTGQGYARNVGITRARGEYLYFMDSDDLLERDALEQLTAIMDEKQLDSLYFDAETFFESAEIEENYPDSRDQFIRNHSFDDVYDGPTLMRLFSESGEYQIQPCLQLYRLDLIQAHNIRFPIGILHEDNIFTFEAMLHAKRASHVQHSFYSRRIRPDSVMTANDSFQNVYSYYKTFWEMLQIYHALSPEIDEMNRTAVVSRVNAVLKVAQQIYCELTSEEKYGRYGLIENLALFNSLIEEPSTNEIKVKQLNDRVAELTSKLKESNAKRDGLSTSLKQARDEKADLTSKLKKSNEKRDELSTSLKQARDEKADLTSKLKESNVKRGELSASLKHVHEEKDELTVKLKRTYDEKVELNKKLQTTYEEKSGINHKLQETYAEKSEINRKLQQTYAEKSELNKKLQATYAEKSERGIQIKAQQATIEELNKELSILQNSWSYRIGRFFTWPIRKIRSIRNQSE